MKILKSILIIFYATIIIMNEKEIQKVIKEAAKEAAKETRHENAIILEEMRSDFRMFGENLSGLRDEVKQNSKEIRELKTEVGTLGDRVSMVEVKVDSINDKLDATFEETGNLKTSKADNERVDKIDLRLVGVEEQLA